MTTAVLDTCVRVPFTNTDDQRKCLQQLTVQQKALSALADPGTLVAYTIRGKVLEVPKLWGLHNLRQLGASTVEDRQIRGVSLHDEDVVSTITHLRPHQLEATDTILRAFESSEYGGGALLVLPCGYGKTITALHVVAKMKMKCLVVCHTDVLVCQWATAIAQYFPNARVGKIQQNICDVHDKTHIIASLKSLAMREYDMTSAGCDVIVVDECQHAAALQLSRAMSNAGCRYRLGLSATPTRPDGLSVFLNWSIGEVVYEVKRPPADDLRVYAVILDEGPVYMKTIRKGGKSISNMAGMINLLTDMTIARADLRQQVAAAWIMLCASKGRKLIILSDRICLLRDLDRRVRDTVTTGFMIGTAKKAERATAADSQVVFASYGVAAEGLDISVDTLLLLSPRSGENVITQCVGRIQRGRGRSPLVIDLVDSVAPFHGMFAKRLRVYKSLGAVLTKYDEARNVIS
ncbi:P-loop containing nucleoside triphosphate hydrolase protein [Tribonema minus]|uniref:P-loop containing nucleoside triphosphate hydrolase protein n=1 Tax=Tribonema minus TaxID=303371 RepID=A0A835YWZ8_9STRA|nr:P-loop containing nucleoside triphosphate hydrolase protein [Tribonema minus]